MSLTVQLYKWHKRVNSTKLPGVADPHTDFSCTLKEPTSIHNPVIILATNDCDFTYAHISAWSRYYFVDDVVYVHNGLVEYHLTEDYLGSNKFSIGSTVANIAYASDHYNADIVDPRMKIHNDKSVSYAVANSTIFTHSYFIVTVFNDNAAVTGGSGMSQSFYLNEYGMESFRQAMSDNDIWSSLKTLISGNPMNFVFSVKWIPYSISSAYYEDVKLKVGNKTLFNSASRIVGFPYMTATASITIPVGHGDFRDYSPFRAVALYLPGVGFMDINPADFPNRIIDIVINIEVITGNILYEIYNNLSVLVNTVNVNVAADITIGRETLNGQGMVSGLLTTAAGIGATVAGAMTGNLVTTTTGAAAALSGAGSFALNANKHIPSITGGYSSRAISAQPDFWLYVSDVDSENPASANYISFWGRPVCETHAINTHSGYVQTIGASVSLDADKEEIETVNRMLDAGIYYE